MFKSLCRKRRHLLVQAGFVAGFLLSGLLYVSLERDVAVITVRVEESRKETKAEIAALRAYVEETRRESNQRMDILNQRIDKLFELIVPLLQSRKAVAEETDATEATEAAPPDSEMSVESSPSAAKDQSPLEVPAGSDRPL